MKKIGFIDYYLDNYHAQNYPKWINEYSNGSLEVTCAYAMMERMEGTISSKEWSLKHGIPVLQTIDEVILKSDCIMVLSPSNPEMHEELSQLALKSGKPVYIDKAFAQDLQSAKRMFSLANNSGTSCCSSSALAFVSAYEEIDKARLQTLSSKGGGSFEVYAIHQFEPIVALMGSKPVKIMSVGDKLFNSFIIEFDDGRIAKMEQFGAAPFYMYAGYTDGTSISVKAEQDIFKGFILKVIEYFKTGTLVATEQQTLAVIALIDAAKIAMMNPFCWIKLEDY